MLFMLEVVTTHYSPSSQNASWVQACGNAHVDPHEEPVKSLGVVSEDVAFLREVARSIAACTLRMDPRTNVRGVLQFTTQTGQGKPCGLSAPSVRGQHLRSNKH